MNATTAESWAVLAARIARAFPTMPPLACAVRARALQKIERAQQRHAERLCDDERYCNSPGVADAASKRIERRIEKWGRELSAFLAPEVAVSFVLCDAPRLATASRRRGRGGNHVRVYVVRDGHTALGVTREWLAL